MSDDTVFGHDGIPDSVYSDAHTSLLSDFTDEELIREVQRRKDRVEPPEDAMLTANYCPFCRKVTILPTKEVIYE